MVSTKIRKVPHQPIWASFFVLLLIVGCRNQGNEQSHLEEQDSIITKRFSGGRLFRLNEPEEPGSLFPPSITDVVAARTATQVYEGLFRLDPVSLEPTENLAEHKKFSKDGRTLKVRLKKGIYFHEDPCFGKEKTRELTAEDVVYCFTNLASPLKTNYSFHVVENSLKGSRDHYNNQLEGRYEVDYEGVVALSKYELEFHLEEYFKDILFLLSRPECSIYPREAVDYYGFDLSKNMVGTGPFKQGRWDENFLILEKNENYHLGPDQPWLTGIKISFLKDKKLELMKFKSGELDMVYALPHDFVLEILEDTYQKGDKGYSHFTLQRTPELATEILGFNLTKFPFSNIDFRKAVAFSIDRNVLVDEVLMGQAFAAGKGGINPPGLVKYDYDKVRGYAYNLDSARYYIHKSGIKTSELPTLQLFTASKGNFNISIAQKIKDQIKIALNLEIELRIVPFSDLIEGISAGDMDFYRVGWTADYPSPSELLSIFSSKSLPDNPDDYAYPNFGRFKNQEFDEWLNISSSTIVDSLVFASYSNAEQILMRNCPVIVLWYDEGFRLLQPHVKNFPMNSIQYRDFREVYFEGAEELMAEK